MSPIQQKDISEQFIQDERQKRIRELYKELAAAKVSDIKQTIEEIEFFRRLYAQELLSSEGAAQTLEILKTLEVQNERDKTEYLRFKAISISGIVA